MKPFVMYRHGFGMLALWTILPAMVICKLALEVERSSGTGLRVLGMGLSAVLASWAILWLVVIRKVVLDSEGLLMSRGALMQKSIPLTEWKRVRIWEVRRRTEKLGLSFGHTESSNAYKVMINTLQGTFELPIFENSDVLNRFRMHIDALFLSLPVEGSRLKKLDGLLLVPGFGVQEEPYHDVGVVLRPEEERLEMVSGISRKNPLSNRFRVVVALICIVIFAGFAWFTPEGAMIRSNIVEMFVVREIPSIEYGP